ncbi:hypothetical protein EDD22DRAFT_764420, partial [Suillus occidentalis]
EKNKYEPIYCAKCQRYSHIARDCTQHHNICANCTEGHRTSECTNNKISHYISCNLNDHISWDRVCPEFKRRGTDLDTRDRGNTMPYY